MLFPEKLLKNCSVDIPYIILETVNETAKSNTEEGLPLG
jgi:hypothetical protein